MNTVVRRATTTTSAGALLAAVALAPVVLLSAGSPAAAAPAPRVSTAGTVTATSCAAVGGTYVRTAGTRYCTVVTTAVADGPVVTSEAGLFRTSWPGGGATTTLVGTSLRRTTTETTVRRSESSTRAVTETRTVKTLASVVVPLSCTERTEETRSGFTNREDGSWVEGSHTVTDLAVLPQRCEVLGLFDA